MENVTIKSRKEFDLQAKYFFYVNIWLKMNLRKKGNKQGLCLRSRSYILKIINSMQGLIDEEKVDSFNIPAYCTRPQELEAIIQKNECFTIESIEFALSDGIGHSPWAPRCIFQHKSHYSGINKGTFWW